MPVPSKKYYRQLLFIRCMCISIICILFVQIAVHYTAKCFFFLIEQLRFVFNLSVWSKERHYEITVFSCNVRTLFYEKPIFPVYVFLFWDCPKFVYYFCLLVLFLAMVLSVYSGLWVRMSSLYFSPSFYY